MIDIEMHPKMNEAGSFEGCREKVHFFLDQLPDHTTWSWR